MEVQEQWFRSVPFSLSSSVEFLPRAEQIAEPLIPSQSNVLLESASE